MTHAESDPIHAELARLDATVDTLVATLQRLGEENRGLRYSQAQLNGERASLISRNDEARSRIEAMIQRLRSIENQG